MGEILGMSGCPSAEGGGSRAAQAAQGDEGLQAHGA